MKRFTQLFLALTLVTVPVAFTSCDDENGNSPYGYVYNDLVTEALSNYSKIVRKALNDYYYEGGIANYYDAYNFFYKYYPNAYNDEFAAFITAVMGSNVQPYWETYNNLNFNWDNNYNNRNSSTDNQLVQEAQRLVGEWKGQAYNEYTDDQTNLRRRDVYTADMKFFQYNSDANSLKGNGTETDTMANGTTQTLDFSWYIANDGDIYIKYTKSGSIFVFDSASKTEGFFLGLEQGKSVDSFFGTASSTNTTDVISIDLQRVSGRNGVASRAAEAGSTKYGKASRSTLQNFTKGAEKATSRK